MQTGRKPCSSRTRHPTQRVLGCRSCRPGSASACLPQPWRASPRPNLSRRDLDGRHKKNPHVRFLKIRARCIVRRPEARGAAGVARGRCPGQACAPCSARCSACAIMRGRLAPRHRWPPAVPAVTDVKVRASGTGGVQMLAARAGRGGPGVLCPSYARPAPRAGPQRAPQPRRAAIRSRVNDRGNSNAENFPRQPDTAECGRALFGQILHRAAERRTHAARAAHPPSWSLRAQAHPWPSLPSAWPPGAPRRCPPRPCALHRPDAAAHRWWRRDLRRRHRIWARPRRPRMAWRAGTAGACCAPEERLPLGGSDPSHLSVFTGHSAVSVFLLLSSFSFRVWCCCCCWPGVVLCVIRASGFASAGPL